MQDHLQYDVLDFFFSSRRRHTRFDCDWSSDVCSSDLGLPLMGSRGAIQPSFRNAAHLWGMFFSGEAAAAGRAMAVRKTSIHFTRYLPKRSGERRVGEECRSRWSPGHLKKKKIERNGDV